MEKTKEHDDEKPQSTIPTDDPNSGAREEARQKAKAISAAASSIVANAMSEDSEAFVSAYKQTGGQ